LATSKIALTPPAKPVSYIAKATFIEMDVKSKLSGLKNFIYVTFYLTF
jgi:hypothetical protein